MKALGRHLIVLGLMEAAPGWFDVFMAHFRAYKAEKGHCNVRLKYKSPDGYRLGQTVSGIRQGRYKLTGEQKAILDAEGFIWKGNDWWPEFIEHFRAFKVEKGHCEVPRHHKSPDEYPLGSKVSAIRGGGNKPTEEQRATLDAEGFIWDATPTGAWWPKFIEHFRAFRVEKGHCLVTKNYKSPDGYPLGKKVAGIRYGGNKLTNEWRAILDAEEFVWNASSINAWWPEFLEHFRAYKTEKGHCNVPGSYKSPDDYPLGQKVKGIRTGSNKPTEEQRATLDAEGFIWNASLKGLWWPEFIEHFRAFRVETGHSQVPIKHKSPDGYPLGSKVQSIRAANIKPTEEQRVILDTEGFIWRVR